MPVRLSRNCLVLAALMMSFPVGRAALADVLLLVDTVVDDATAATCLDGVSDDCSLRGAITAANAVPVPEPVTISLPAGNYLLSINGPGEDDNQTGDLDVLRGCTIQGAFVITTDVDGGGNGGLDDRLLEVHGAGTLLVVDNVTFERSVPPADLHAVAVGPGASILFSRVYIESTGSLADGGGGLLVEEGASASVDDSKVWFNSGFEGGGILVQDGTLLLTDSEVSNNIASVRGGGIAVLDNTVGPVDTATVIDSHLFDNISGDGGGVWAGTGTEVLLTDDFLENNQSTLGPSRMGGGIFSHGQVVVDGTTITGGSANAGVAIFVGDTGDGASQLDMINSTASGTSLDPGISAIHLVLTTAELLHVTMVGNESDIFASQSSFQVTGSLFEGGCLLLFGTIVLSGGANLGLDSSCWIGAPSAGDMVVADLLLNPLGPSNGPTPIHFPQSLSPAVDHGPGPCLPDDQLRMTRPAIGCDSGSVERLPLEALFLDDFEGGSTSAWSATTP